MSADWLIYCNGDSYSNNRYHFSLNNSVYANVVGKHLNGFVINKSINGSCNRRIIRTTVHDILLQRKLNPTQPILVLIGLSFELRSELWVDDYQAVHPEESNFVTHSFSRQLNWRENLLANLDIETCNTNNLDPTFYKKYSDGRAFFFSPYAERINLLTDLTMLKSLLDSLDVKFLIFQAPRAEKLDSDYLLDYLKETVYADPRILNSETFGFLNWCHENKFIPLDLLDSPEIGHYGQDAHKAFAEQFLIPKLTELKQI